MTALSGGSKLTWFGHSTFLVETGGGSRILIDPWVMNNPACPEELHDPGDLDAMLITHAHFDHIGDAVELAKQKTPGSIVAIAETAGWLDSKGAQNTVGMNLGGTVEVAGCKANMVFAAHSCGITDGDQTLYGGSAAGFVVELEDGFRIYHAGDTAVFGDMQLIGRLLKPDIALLPIGDHFTMGPMSAAEAIRLLGVKTVVPMHHGTFPLLTGTPADLRREASDIDGLEIVHLEPGATLA
jgi:L-ascorbate metabolism protein UlaG (beta-lactamase superfamily)